MLIPLSHDKNEAFISAIPPLHVMTMLVPQWNMGSTRTEMSSFPLNRVLLRSTAGGKSHDALIFSRTTILADVAALGAHPRKGYGR